MKRERPYRTVSRRYVRRSACYSVRHGELPAPDGSAAVTVVEKPGGAWTAPVTDDGALRAHLGRGGA